ncbi:aromatic-ring-hydroxylating dioxygenase subunit beta [Propioniferax innocua]|uniref:Ethylbenzene dioxygenase beta subunit/biphenyl 2,3-dioxygenase beta subunit n=1 Tax=Propioniferax innocua TaxID=1753 RepID=A0A542ZSP7_9ACTN|nr:aromatic-ring-hydroxylating dioxygenase subunit beta [Propioniferax innocua]TQL63316.1 ethylbenzene dioxygenase beta subunit/biphenyl 2,3-dioxygenase beta subunit [Propioniferax innocua]
MTDKVNKLLADVDPAEERAISRFLLEEAQILDDWEWAAWLDFWHEDCLYWAPTQLERLQREIADRISTFGTSAYFEENKTQLKQRVDRLLTHMAWGEAPPSRARHLITNIRVTKAEGDGVYTVKSNFLDYRSNGQRSQDHITGERTDTILRAPDSEWGYLIKERRILFDMSTILTKNLSLFY